MYTVLHAIVFFQALESIGRMKAVIKVCMCNRVKSGLDDLDNLGHLHWVTFWRVKWVSSAN